ncbi:MAG: FtsQ-type POTRA domain-containing protein, partial [Pseudomonadota bacterium]|nr:FtsQ-type POTRA domain-containing protein [Pseudomonadota bacterium]
MNQSTVQIPSRSGIYATRKVPGSQARSLKLMDRVRISLVLTGFLLLCFGVFLQQNFDRGAGFINRPISKVRIENQWQYIREEEVSWLLAEFMGAGFFNFDMAGVKQILEQHPWVHHATIKKLWPESISLHITEQVAIAQWGHSQLLSQNGETFKPIGIES